MKFIRNKLLENIVFIIINVVFIILIISISLKVDEWFFVIILLPLSLYIADAIGGLIHLFFDYSPCKAGVGINKLYFYKGDRSLMKYKILKKNTMKNIGILDQMKFDFKLHHLKPNVIARRSTIDLLLTGLLVMGVPFFSIIVFLMFLTTNFNVLFLLLTTSFFVTLTQFSHACAHNHSKNFFIIFLQKNNMFIHPKVHDHHHIVLDKDFSILNGWSNPLINFFAKQCFKKRWISKSGLTPK